jgi:hypothetical protein
LAVTASTALRGWQSAGGYASYAIGAGASWLEALGVIMLPEFVQHLLAALAIKLLLCQLADDGYCRLLVFFIETAEDFQEYPLGPPE